MRVWVSTVVVVLLMAVALSAQVNTGQISGTVTDSSGAVVVGALVTVTNPERGVTRVTRSGSTGSFSLPYLAPGTYDVKVESANFATSLQKGVVVAVGSSPLVNISLKPGKTSETVTVSGEAAQINTTNSEISASVSPVEVTNLPIRDRNFAGLMAVVPGVRPAEAFDPTKTRSGNISLNGSDGRSFDYNVDGGDNKDNVIGGIVQNFTMDGIQEFNVATNRYSAEMGRTAAGVVNVVSKSGSNKFHGSAFGMLQNSGLDANNYFTLKGCEENNVPSDKCSKPLYHRYHMGGSIGGPIKKDKLFFFGAYEHKREPGKIPADPTASQELALLPLASPIGVLPFNYFDHMLTAKLDWKLGSNQSMFARYGRERWTNDNDQLSSPFHTDASGTNTDTNQFHDMVVSHSWTLSNSVVNVASVHFQDFVNQIFAAPGRTFTVPVAGGTSATNPNLLFPSGAEIGTNANVPQETLIRKYQFRDDLSWTKGNHNQKVGVNFIDITRLGGFFFFGANGYQLSFWDDPSVIEINKAAYPNGLATPGAISELTFSGGSGSTHQPAAQSVGLYYQDDWKLKPNLMVNLGLRWDANPNFLPKQLGSTPETSNRTILLLQQLAAVTSGGAAADGVARAKSIVGDTGLLRKTTADWKEFQPRVGFNWSPGGKGRWVIRGGYGIARDQVFQNLTLFALQQAQPTLYQTVIDLKSSVAPGTAGCAGALCAFRFGVDPLPAPAPGLSSLAFGAFGRINDPHMTDPWSQQASIGTEYQVKEDYVFSTDYYHTLGTHEPRVLNINPVIGSLCDASFAGSNPTDPRCVRGAATRYLDAAFVAAGLGAGRLEQSNMIGTNNRSMFDSLNFQLKKRFSHKFMFQTSYVLSWSRSWGGVPTASYGGNSIAVTPEAQFLPSEFGPTIFDERHRFVFSGVFRMKWGFELAPLFQASSARPYSFIAGKDLNGDGRSSVDRVCAGSTLTSFVETPGCSMVQVNSLRGKPYINTDLRATKNFQFGEVTSLKVFWEFFNLFNRDNFCNDYKRSARASNFNQPLGYCNGPDNTGFNAFGGPFRSQFGMRFEF
jgi:hypothetical protein